MGVTELSRPSGSTPKNNLSFVTSARMLGPTFPRTGAIMPPEVLMKKLAAFIGLVILASCSTTPEPAELSSSASNTALVQSSKVTLDQIPNMTSEEIESLSEEQMNSVFAQAEIELEAFAQANGLKSFVKSATANDAEDLARAARKWPNYGYTLYVATIASYESYNNYFYRAYKGPTWSDDGCSRIPPSIFDNNACRQHDFGYRNVPQYRQGRNETVRKNVDGRFLSNMKVKCDREYDGFLESVKRLQCRAQALVIYGAVRVGGKGSYDKTDARFP
jgi:hypothetical protein